MKLIEQRDLLEMVRIAITNLDQIYGMYSFFFLLLIILTFIVSLHHLFSSDDVQSKDIEETKPTDVAVGDGDNDDSVYPLNVDRDQEDKATELKLCSFAQPHMRAFHFAWWSFFIAFFIWFAIAVSVVFIALIYECVFVKIYAMRTN